MPYQTIPPANTSPSWMETQAEATTMLATYPAPIEGERLARLFFFADAADKVGSELDPSTFTPLARP